MNNRERLIERLRKLKAQHEGEKKIGNMEAAESAAALFHDLLVKYKIEEAELGDNEAGESIDTTIFDWTAYGFKHRVRPNVWTVRLASTICEAYGCKIMVNTRNPNILYIVGKRSTFDVVSIVLPMLRRAAEELAASGYNRAYAEAQANFRKDLLVDYTKNFLMGFTFRLRVRFDEIAARRASAAAQNALVVISNDLIAANEEVKRQANGSFNMNQAVRQNSRAFQDGKESADTVVLEENRSQLAR